MSTNGTRIRVIVVEGDPAVRQGMTRLLGHHPMIEVVASALNGRTAIPKVGSYQPHCVVVNLATAGDETLALLAHLRASDARGIVVATADLDPEMLQRAQEVGSAELVRCATLPASETAVASLVQELLPRVLRAGGAGLRAADGAAASHAVVAEAAVAAIAAASRVAAVVTPSSERAVPASAPVAGLTPPLRSRPLPPSRSLKVVGIGVSTGGPKALTEMLPRLPADFPLPIVLVQHMPPKFTQSLAESLDRLCKLRVSEAREGDRLERGRILIAPGGKHLRVGASDLGEVARLTEDPPECSCRPSVDYLFRSLTETYGGRVLGCVLTGMGEDGWIGSRLIHQAGGRVLAQSEPSCTVYGMPRGPIESGIATAVSLDQMADAIVQSAKGAPCN